MFSFIQITKMLKICSMSHSVQIRILRLKKVKKCSSVSPAGSVYVTAIHQTLHCFVAQSMRSKTAPSAPFHGFIFMAKCSPSKRKRFFPLRALMVSFLPLCFVFILVGLGSISLRFMVSWDRS